MRLALTALLIGLCAAAHAQTGPASCAGQGAIVTEAVDARLTGATARQARRAIASTLPAAALKPAVPLLVEWVYSLPPEQLTPDAGPAYAAACAAQ